MSDLGDFIAATPPAVMHRTGMMSAWANRLLLALVDGDQSAAATLTESIAGYDSAHADSATPYPMGAFDFAIKELARVTVRIADHGDRRSHGWTNAKVVKGARDLARQRCPQHWQAETGAVLDGFTVDQQRFNQDLPQEMTAGLLLAVGCCGAWMFRQLSSGDRAEWRRHIDAASAEAQLIANRITPARRQQSSVRVSPPPLAADTDRDSGDERERLRPLMTAATFLGFYLALAGDLAEQRPVSIPQTRSDDPDRALAAALAAAIRDLELSGHAEDAAQTLTWLRPRTARDAATGILREVASWLDESGFRPAADVWCAGAVPYLLAMVPTEHRLQALELLNYEWLRTCDSEIAERVGLVDLAAVEGSPWLNIGDQAHPVAFMHAAGALAAWVYAEPGAVNQPLEKALRLARDSYEMGKLVWDNPDLPPQTGGPRASFPQAIPEPAEPTGRPVPIVYTGPPMSLWQAAWLFAAAITNVRHRRRQGVAPDADAGDTEERVFLARAITVYAEQAGLGTGPVATPELLAGLSMTRLYLTHLHEIRGTLDFVKPGGSTPEPDEPGYQLYRTMVDQMLLSGVTPEEVVADKELSSMLGQTGERLSHQLQLARRSVTAAAVSTTSDPQSTAPLGLIGDLVNQQLQQG